MADEIPDKERKYKIDILIGNDYYDDIIKSEKLEVEKGLYLIDSSLGWILSGRVSETPRESEPVMFICEDSDVAQGYWDMETIGIKDKTQNEENSEALSDFKKNIKMHNRRYNVGWLWKRSKYELTSNYKLSVARLKSQTQNQTKDVMKKYDEIFKQQLKDGIIEIADSSTEYLQQESVVAHYLPHHAVMSADKLHVVFPGNAKTHPSKRSLNDCLHCGPNMIANLCGPLLCFRMNKVAIVADIRQAYVQLLLRVGDRDVVRFVWLKDIEAPFSDNNIEHNRFCRVIWGVVCAAFLLAATVYYHLSKYDSDIARDIADNLYADNLISGASSVVDAVQYYKETKSIFGDASMNMCKWKSYDNEVMDAIPFEDRKTDEHTKLLGMLWKKTTDILSITKIERPPTHCYETLYPEVPLLSL